MKARMRKVMKRTLQEMSSDLAAAKSRRACRNIANLPEFDDADVVMLYLPIPTEVDTTPLALEAWTHDKTVVVPKVSWEQRHMVAVECRSIDDEMEVDDLGLRTPRNGRMFPYHRIDLLIVPALAFDRTGNRLGRGGGFYDRFLAEPGVSATPIGLAFDEQVVDDLPTHHHDQPVHILASDREVLRFDKAAASIPDAEHLPRKETASDGS